MNSNFPDRTFLAMPLNKADGNFIDRIQQCIAKRPCKVTFFHNGSFGYIFFDLHQGLLTIFQDTGTDTRGIKTGLRDTLNFQNKRYHNCIDN